MLHGEITQTILDHPKGTIILLTGDGNPNDDRTIIPKHQKEVDNNNFVKSCVRSISHGFKVEVWAFKGTISQNFVKLQKEFADSGQFKLLYLDDFSQYFSFRQL